MKLESTLLLCVAVAIFMGVVTSCKKDGTTKDYIIPDEKDTTVIVPPKEDTVYVIDTTKKITINEIKFWEDYNMAAVSGNWNKVAYGNGRWVAVGYNGQIATSTNGTSWSTQTVGTNTWYSVAYGNGIWVAGGNGGSITTSTDGVNWTNVININNNNQVRGIAYGNGRWVVVTYLGGSLNKTFATSTNLIDWININIGGYTDNWYSVAYGNGLWMASGSGNYLATSTNGTSWTINQIGGTFNRIAYGDGIWVAASYNQKIFTSTDNGATWGVQLMNPTGVGECTDVAYYNGFWVVVGYQAFAISTDGTTWITQQVDTGTTGNVNWYGVAIKND